MLEFEWSDLTEEEEAARIWSWVATAFPAWCAWISPPMVLAVAGLSCEDEEGEVACRPFWSLVEDRRCSPGAAGAEASWSCTGSGAQLWAVVFGVLWGRRLSDRQREVELGLYRRDEREGEWSSRAVVSFGKWVCRFGQPRLKEMGSAL